MATKPIPPASIPIIRISLLGGVLLFGAIVFYLHSTDAAPSATGSAIADPVFTWAFFGLCAASAAAIVVLRGLAERAPTFDRSASMAIAAWAVGEGVALLGGVHWLLTGTATLYLAGLFVFVAGLLTVSAGAEQGRG